MRDRLGIEKATRCSARHWWRVTADVLYSKAVGVVGPQRTFLRGRTGRLRVRYDDEAERYVAACSGLFQASYNVVRCRRTVCTCRSESPRWLRRSL